MFNNDSLGPSFSFLKQTNAENVKENIKQKDIETEKNTIDTSALKEDTVEISPKEVEGKTNKLNLNQFIDGLFGKLEHKEKSPEKEPVKTEIIKEKTIEKAEKTNQTNSLDSKTFENAVKKLIENTGGENKINKSSERFLNTVSFFFEKLKTSQDPIESALNTFDTLYFPEYKQLSKDAKIKFKEAAKLFIDKVKVFSSNENDKDLNTEPVKMLMALDFANTYYKQPEMLKAISANPPNIDLNLTKEEATKGNKEDAYTTGFYKLSDNLIKIDFQEFVHGLNYGFDGSRVLIHELVHFVDTQNEDIQNPSTWMDSILPGMEKYKSKIASSFTSLSDFWKNAGEAEKSILSQNGLFAVDYMLEGGKENYQRSEFMPKAVEIYKETKGNFFFNPSEKLPTNVKDSLKTLGKIIKEWLGE